MARPVLALLTDFGTRDHYVGSMKAVALAICPEATFVDITHHVPPHDVETAAIELAASYRYFPAGAVFLVVVDPGVGSARRALAAEAGDYRFVAPDNGVLTLVFRETPPKRVVDLTERRYARPTVSRTFEGRDRLAPAAAWLAKGIQLSGLGRPVTDYQVIEVAQPVVHQDAIEGAIQLVDRFGNLVTNIDRRSVERIAHSGHVQIQAGTHSVGRLVATYAEAAPGEVCALFGSTDRLEIAVSGGNAAERLGLARGSPVMVRRA
jgi:S-adenosylmethionine hydrolase